MLPCPRSGRSVFAVAVLVRVAALAAAFATLAARATDGTWTSASDDTSWDSSGNWSGGTVADGTSATATFGPTTYNYDFGGTVYIHLDGSRTIGNLVFNTAHYDDGNDNSGNASWQIDSYGDSNIVLTLAGSSPTITTNATAKLDLVVDGTSGFTKAGSAALVLNQANTYTGTTYVTQGTLNAQNLQSLGSGDVVLSGSGSTVGLNAQGTFTNAFTLGASTRLEASPGGGRTTTASGGVTLTGNATVNAGFNGTFELTGALSGNFSLTVGQSSFTNSFVSFTGSSANTYTGTTTLNGGNLNLGKTSGVTAIAGDLVIGNGSNTVVVKLNSSDQIANSSAVTLKQNGTFNLNGQTETIGSLAGTSGSSYVTLGSGALTVGANNTSTSFAGVISGSGTLTKIGSGTLTLSGASTHTGGTNLSAGTLTLNSPNTLQSATGTLAVSGGTLSSSVGNSTIGSDLTFTSGSIDLGGTSSGRLTLASGKTFAMSGGTLTLTLGSSFDTIYSAGSGTLSLTGGVIALDTSGVGFSYGSTYQVFSGFNSASFGSLTLNGYDTTNYTASFSNSGLLSFAASAVPEPSTYAVLLGLAALGLAGWRRRNTQRS